MCCIAYKTFYTLFFKMKGNSGDVLVLSKQNVNSAIYVFQLLYLNSLLLFTHHSTQY